MTKQWEQVTTAGNQAFAEKCWPVAQDKYEQALYTARQTYVEWQQQDVDLALTRVLVSFFNLADTHQQQNNILSATQLFEQCFQFLEAQLLTVEQGSDAQLSVIAAYSQARSEWLLFKGGRIEQPYPNDPPALQRIAQSLQQEQSIH